MHRAMKRAGPGIPFLVILSALLLLPHCSGMFREGGLSPGALTPDDIPGEMKRLEEIARSDPDPSERATAHRRLAALLSSQGNPSADYARALEELRIAVALDPEKEATDTVRDWLAVLTEIDLLGREKEEMKQRIEQLMREGEEVRALREKAIDENRDLKTKNSELNGALEHLAKEQRELKATVEKLTGENAELRNVVEQLKELDVQLEEKRRKVR